jgi:hypothetical protein
MRQTCGLLNVDVAGDIAVHPNPVFYLRDGPVHAVLSMNDKEGGEAAPS